MLFEDAIKAAERSSVRRHKTGAAVYDSNMNLLAIGWSHVPEGKLVSTPWSKHAENHALARAHGKGVPHTIVIATLTKAGNVTKGDPCSSCAAQIKRAGIKRIFYTQQASS